MSFSATPERTTPIAKAYPRFARVKDAFKCVRDAFRQGHLETTKSKHIADTFGLRRTGDVELVKRMKARFRNELSFGEGK